MKKKLVLKKGVEKALLIVLFIMILIVSSECDNTILFAISHIISGVIALLIGMILVSYGRERD
jgi:hypothetical protein